MQKGINEEIKNLRKGKRTDKITGTVIGITIIVAAIAIGLAAGSIWIIVVGAVGGICAAAGWIKCKFNCLYQKSKKNEDSVKKLSTVEK